MAKMSMKAFEKSGKDKEKKGMKEGSKREEAFDRKQLDGPVLPKFAAGKKPVFAKKR